MYGVSVRYTKHITLVCSIIFFSVLLLIKFNTESLDLIEIPVKIVDKAVKPSFVSYYYLSRAVIIIPIIFILCGYGFNKIKNQSNMFLLLLGSVANTTTINSIIEWFKSIVKEKRPCYNALAASHPDSYPPGYPLESFPSGHTSCTFGLMIYMTYLCCRMKFKKYSVILISFSASALGVFVGLTRYLDNKHHIHDILGGCAIGLIIGYAYVKYVNDNCEEL